MTYEEFQQKIKNDGRSLHDQLDSHVKDIGRQLHLRALKEVSKTEWPFKRTGGLFRSIRVIKRKEPGQVDFHLRAGDGITYAGYVERGTRRIRPRRYLFRTIRNWQRNKSVVKRPGGQYNPQDLNRGKGKGFDFTFLKLMLNEIMKGKR